MGVALLVGVGVEEAEGVAGASDGVAVSVDGMAVSDAGNGEPGAGVDDGEGVTEGKNNVGEG